MPSEHPLPELLVFHPQYNRPLALSALAVEKTKADSAGLVVIDVGANIGDTVAIIEQVMPGKARYLCVEPEPDLAILCRRNHANNARVEVIQAFIGELEGVSVVLTDDGRANPTTTVTDAVEGAGTLVRLDTLAKKFAAAAGGVDLIKVDTEGFDFAVLRSAEKLLTQHGPALFFEWFPQVLPEDPVAASSTWRALDMFTMCSSRIAATSMPR